MSEVEWKKQKAALESSPDYIIVRKSKKAGTIAGAQTNEGKDGIATTYFEINKNDLGAAGGGGYDDTKIYLELANLQDQIDDLDIPDTSDLATKNELTALQNQVTKDIADLTDHLNNHPSGDTDLSDIEDAIQKLNDDLADLGTALKAVEDGLAQEVQDRQEGDKHYRIRLMLSTPLVMTTQRLRKTSKQTPMLSQKSKQRVMTTQNCVVLSRVTQMPLLIKATQTTLTMII